MKAVAKSIGVAGIFLIPPAWSYAESILLKNGTIIKGAIVEMNETDATVDTADMGRIVIKRRAIQSMSDGVDTPTSPAQSLQPSTPASAVPMIVNNNNNNNNNNAATSSQATTATHPALSEAPAAVTNSDRSDIKNTKTAIAEYGERLSADFGFGYSYLQVKTTGEFDHFAKSSEGPAFHLAPIKYKTAEGITFGLLGDGMFHSSRDPKIWTKLLHGGGNIGWTSEQPSAGSSGGSWSINGTFGYGYLTDKPDSYFDERTYEGALVGMNMSYAYYSSDGVGFDLGASAFEGELVSKLGSKSVHSHYSAYRKDTGKRSISSYIAYAGISKRF